MDRNVWDVIASIAAVVAVIAVLAALVLGGYGLYWWLAKDTTEKRYDTNTKNQQYQSALIAQNRDRLQAIDIATNEGQRKQLTLTFCASVTEITDPPPDLVAGFERVCL